MYCSFCGYELGVDDLFCPNCGASISDQIVDASENKETKSAVSVKSTVPSSSTGTAKKSRKRVSESEEISMPEAAQSKAVRAKAHTGVGKIHTDSRTGLEGVVVKETSVFRYVISFKEYRESWRSFERRAKDLDSEAPKPCGFSTQSSSLRNPNPDELDDFPAFRQAGTGWFVPALDDLKTFTIDEGFTDADRQAVNKTLLENGGDPLPEIGSPVFYWSSTESLSDPLSAVYVSLLSKSVGERSKYSKMSVRLFLKVRK